MLLRTDRVGRARARNKNGWSERASPVARATTASRRDALAATFAKKRRQWARRAAGYKALAPDAAREMLRAACASDDVEAARAAVAGGAGRATGDILGCGGGFSAVCEAAYWGSAGVVKFLVVEAGEDADEAEGDNGWTPAFVAAQQGRTGVVSALAGLGADLNRAPTGGPLEGLTPLDVALRNPLGKPGCAGVAAVLRAMGGKEGTPAAAAARPPPKPKRPPKKPARPPRKDTTPSAAAGDGK